MISPTKIYDTQSCVICYDDYKKNHDNECLLLKCGHIFHEKCITPWINEHRNCPTCREKAIIHIHNIQDDIFKDLAIQGVNGVFRTFDWLRKFALVGLVFVVAVDVLNFLSPGTWEIKEEDKWDFNDLKNCYKLMLTMKAIAVIGSLYLFVKFQNYVKNQKALAPLTRRINYQPND